MITPKAGGDVGKLDLIHCGWECGMGQVFWKIWRFLKKHRTQIYHMTQEVHWYLSQKSENQHPHKNLYMTINALF